MNKKALSHERIPLSGDKISSPLKALNLYERQASRVLFGTAAYRIVRYDSSGEPLENRKISGLFSLLLPEFIDQLSGRENVIFPKAALKEALANAVAHAAYFENDGEIVLEIHPNQITVGNLCIRESIYFANKWFSRSRKTVNGLLMESLRIGGFVDELGRGKNLILSESLKIGNPPPEVSIENAGKYKRWKLTIYGGVRDERMLRILKRCKEVYSDERKALLALSMVFWKDLTIDEIKSFLDGDYNRLFAEVLAEFRGPIVYSSSENKVYLTRWASILLGEGKDSKALSLAEDDRLIALCSEICNKYYHGEITPMKLRELAFMGNTKSEKTLSSNILSGWVRKGVVIKRGKGKYTFRNNEKSVDMIKDILEKLRLNP